jgi:DNA-binding transcriptional regulator YdaS (Cro superfamily)
VPVRYALAIERATAQQVTRADLFPDDFWLIWPDLVEPTQQAA